MFSGLIDSMASENKVVFKVFKLSFVPGKFTTELDETTSQGSDQSFYKSSSVLSSSSSTKFDSASVELFNSSSLSVQSLIDVEPSTQLGQFSQTVIKSTYNSKAYSIDLDKSSIDNYVAQNGLVTFL